MKELKWYKVLLAGFGIGIAIQMRLNTIIVLIALVILLIFKLRTHTKKSLVLLVSIVLGALCISSAVDLTFRPYEYTEEYGIPAITYVAMGMNDDPHLGMGWFNGINITIYSDEANGDIALAKELSVTYMRERWESMSEEKMILDFYSRKILSQWNAPLFSSLSLNANHIYDAEGWLVRATYSEEGSSIVESFANIHQIIVYLCFVFANLAIVFSGNKKSKHMEMSVVALVIFGGFLFSILWEAKARYIYPYYIFMQIYIPIGAMVFYELLIKKIVTFNDYIKRVRGVKTQHIEM
ncbi:MAG: hypothetical protein R3Y47_13075 [Lachnospiraceae bacterium]